MKHTALKPHVAMRKWLCSGWLVTLLLWLPASHAQPVSEQELKAAFIYNFIVFTDWPPEAVFERSTLNICTNPNGTMHQPLQRLTAKSVNGRKIAIRPLATADTLRTCHVMFLEAADRDYWKKIRKDAALMPLLTISDDEARDGDGSIIVLVTSQDRIVFDIDTRAAGMARLSLSSKLLRLARAVL